MALPDLTGQNIENTYQRVIQTDGTNFYDGTGSLVNFGGAVFPYTGSAIISGSLIVTGSTEIQYLTASGLNYPSIDGDEKQLITTDGSGNLSLDWSDRTNLDVKNTSGTTLAIGTPVYISGFQGASIFQIAPSSASISSSMPAVGVLDQELAPNEQGYATILGALRGYNTSLLSVNDSLYVGEGVLTKDRPTGSALIQKIARVGNSQNNGEITVIGAGRSNDVPNLPPGYAWIGNDNWVATAVPTSSFNEDPFPYTGSAAISGALEVTGDVTIYGTASVNVLITNYESSSIIYSSGSTKFGDSLDDTHQFTGSAEITGSLDVVGSISASTAEFSSNLWGSDDFPVLKVNGTAMILTQYDSVVLGSNTNGGDNSARGSNVIVGKNAMSNYTYSNGNSYRNVAIGISAMNSGTGAYNVAIGRNAMRSGNKSNTVGIGNATFEKGGGTAGVAVGGTAGRFTTGNYNVLLGYSAGYGVSGTSTFSNTISIGYQSGYFLTTGANNIIIGNQAGYNTSGSNNILLGYQAGYNLTGSNQLIIANNSSSALVTGDFANNTFDVSGSISSTDTVTAVTGSFSHLKGNSPITVQDPVTFQHEQGLDVLGNATIHSINEVELQTISKDFNYTSSLNVAEITASVNGAIIDYRLTNLNSGSRVGTFMYAHDGAELSYNDLTIPGGGIGDQPILSASLVNDLVKIDIENAAGFNFTGYAKKFNKLANAIPVANPNINYLLDTYLGAAAAYSLRQLSQFYTGSAVRVREAGSNTETDIGFDVNGNLDTTALAIHCGANNGFVVTWYDQSGNANDATQTTTANQPKIYDSSTGVITRNGKPAIYTDRDSNSSGDTLVTPATTWMDTNLEYACMTVFTSGSGNVGDTWVWDSSGGGTNKAPSIKSVSGVGIQMQALGTTNAIIVVSSAGQAIRSAYLSSGTLEAFYNGSSAGTATAAGTYNISIERYIGSRIGANEGHYDGYFQEMIWYANDQSSNRTGIESNINDYYNIYDTGLLAEYGGAAAAYSVRLLDSAYTGSALRIREDGTNTETDIGFDSNGDLDTASIASHCGANNGLVVTWYDQSGNGNDASQNTVGSQPKIYDGTTGVVTENGKPAVQFDGSGDKLATNTSFTLYNLMTVCTSEETSYNYGNFISFQNGNNYSGLGVGNSNTQIYGYGDGSDTGADIDIYQDTVLFNSGNTTFANTENQHVYFLITNGQKTAGGMSMGHRYAGGFGTLDCLIQEVVIYPSDQSSNRTGIENNINLYFNIYS